MEYKQELYLIAQIVITAVTIAGAYYKLQKDIALLDRADKELCAKLEEMQLDRTKKWASYEGAANENRKCMEEMRRDIAIIRTKIELFVEDQLKHLRQ